MKIYPKPPVQPLLFAIALLIALAIHACSLAPFDSTQTLRVGISRWPGFDVAFYAKEAGLFKKRGLEVELIPFENQQDIVRAVMRDALDAGFIALWDAMQADPGTDNPAFILTTNISQGADGIVTRSAVRSLEDLRGKTVGAKLGTVNHLILLEALKHHKIEPSEVQVVDISNEEAAKRLRDNRLDSAVTWEPLLTETAKAVQGNIVYTTQEIDSLVIDGLVSRSSHIQDKKAEFKKFILAWFDLMQAIETQPQEVFEIVGKQFGQTGEAFASDYAGLKKGDIALNRQMFVEGGLQAAVGEMVQLLRADPRHGRIVREDIDLDADPVTAAIQAWRS
ncbi:MAG: ABC transporter substrate-binding protein [Cyanobacteriota bacterium]|nr:ABC transporter substrate-binding protein [Cyanobacteriota bacterium]